MDLLFGEFCVLLFVREDIDQDFKKDQKDQKVSRLFELKGEKCICEYSEHSPMVSHSIERVNNRKLGMIGQANPEQT